MKKQAYMTKSGHKLYKPVMSMRQLERMFFSCLGPGWCLACGSYTDGVEPDARGYECPKCGARKVYGMEELMMRDLISFSDR